MADLPDILVRVKAGARLAKRYGWVARNGFGLEEIFIDAGTEITRLRKELAASEARVAAVRPCD